MPIDYNKYPPNWKTEIRPRILQRAKNCCEECGVKNYEYGVRLANGVFESIQNLSRSPAVIDINDARLWADAMGMKLIKIVLTVAHKDHDTTNNTDDNLIALCQYHHLQYDQQYHKQNARRTRNAKRGLQDMFNPAK